MTAPKINHRDRLNRRDPTARDLKEGDLLEEMIGKYNTLLTKFNALCTKLDGDSGVNQTNYAATIGIAGGSIVSLKDRG
jgi:hypothetical protein